MSQAPSGAQGLPPQDPERLKEIVKAVPWEDIQAIFRSDDRRNYKIDIETDALMVENDIEQKQQTLEFVKTITDLMGQMIPAMQMNPSIAPFGKELIMFTAKGFKIGRTLEESLEDTFSQISNMPPPPNPEAEKAKQEAEMKAQEMQLKMQEMQLKLQQMQAQIAAQGQKAQIDMQRGQADIQAKAMQTQADMAAREMDLEMKGMELDFKAEEMAMKREQAAFDMHMKRWLAEQQGQMQQQKAQHAEEAFRDKQTMQRQSARAC